ncbi:hypothetical protein MNBD_PLANCTO03-2071, partial [hydrothermal vent metagenome]
MKRSLNIVVQASSLHRILKACRLEACTTSWRCLAAMVVLGLAGCGGPLRLMPVPTVVAIGVVEPMVGVRKDRQTTGAPVFIASGRTLSDGRDAAEPFTDARSHVTHLAVSEVSLGGGVSWEELARATVGEGEGERPLVEHVDFAYFGVLRPRVPTGGLTTHAAQVPIRGEALSVQQWIDQLNEALASEDTGEAAGEILLYVHGYNTEYASNTGMAAELWH